LGSFQRSGGTVNLTGKLDDTGTTLTLNPTTGSWNLAGGAIKNGHYSASGAAELAFTSSGGTLDGVTADSDLDLATNFAASAFVQDGLTLNNVTVYLGNGAGSTYGSLSFNGTQTLGGTGTVLFGKTSINGLSVIGGGTLTIGSGITVRGSSGIISGNSVLNQGIISADDSGGTAGGFIYDTGFNGGNAGNTADAIDTSGVANAPPQTVCQTFRQGSSFTYTLFGLTAGASYTLRLHFADSSSTAVGQRKFNVSVNGTQMLTNFDIFATAGGKDKAVVEPLSVTANSQGQLVVAFSSGAASVPLVNGIEVDSGGSLVQAVDCGELAGGTISISPGTFTNNGSLSVSNGESLTISGMTPNAGVIAAGIGSKITVSGGFKQGASGTLAFAIGGKATGQYGQLVVSGSSSATLAGTLNASIVNGYSPQAGDAVPIITFTSSTGQFSTVKVSNLPAGIAANLLYNPTNVTLAFGNALLADSALLSGPGTAANLAPRELTPGIEEAIDRWAAAGVSGTDLARLRRLKFQIANLPGAELGMQDGNTIWMDENAAGPGWFLDAAPWSNRAFFRPVAPDELQAPVGSSAFGKMDLLTVVEHEMGHVLGLGEAVGTTEVMNETLAAGVRRLPSLARSTQSRPFGSQIVRFTRSGATRVPVTPRIAGTPLGRLATAPTPSAVDRLLETGDILSVARSISESESIHARTLAFRRASLRSTIMHQPPQTGTQL
jgi:hypothetical protein